jgi:hypothetical protein
MLINVQMSTDNNIVVEECYIANTDMKCELVVTSSVWMAFALAYESIRAEGKNPASFMTSKTYKEDTSMAMLNSAINKLTESDGATISGAWANVQRTTNNNEPCPVVSDVLKRLNQMTSHNDKYDVSPSTWGNTTVRATISFVHQTVVVYSMVGIIDSSLSCMDLECWSMWFSILHASNLHWESCSCRLRGIRISVYFSLNEAAIYR